MLVMVPRSCSTGKFVVPYRGESMGRSELREVLLVIFVRQTFAAAFKIMSAPISALSGSCGRLPGGPFAEYDPALGQIVGRHFDMYAVSNDRSDTVATHLTCCIADDPVLIIEGDAKATIRQDLVDRAFHRNEFFFRQIASFAYEKSSARTNSVAEPGVREKEVVPLAGSRAVWQS